VSNLNAFFLTRKEEHHKAFYYNMTSTRAQMEKQKRGKEKKAKKGKKGRKDTEKGRREETLELKREKCCNRRVEERRWGGVEVDVKLKRWKISQK
jgi:hypothetical protein